MAQATFAHTIRVAVVSAVFATGFLCGTLTQRSADAQMDKLGGVMKDAAGAGGALGAGTQLGTSIVEMQQHVSGLQKNLDTLNKIKASLGG